MDIFVAPSPQIELLVDFVRALTPALGLKNITQRESSNYAEGLYFKATLLNNEVQIYYLDTEGLEQWLFLVSISDPINCSSSELARKIAALGFPCFIPEGKWHLKSWPNKGAYFEP